MMTEKVAAWRPKYDAFIEAAQREPFRWGEHDCVMFAAKALDVQYDIGLIAYINSTLQYYDEETALEVLDEYASFEDMVSSILGIAPVPPAHLTVGDVALVETLAGEFTNALAVHDGHQLLVPDAVGLRVVPVDRALKGWKL